MKIAIVAGGPSEELPNLSYYQSEVDCWIGADSGALALLKQGLPIDIAIGDFDSVSQSDYEKIQKLSKQSKVYPAEKDETDLELALFEAIKLNPEMIYMFGVTAGRLDHEFINVQQLYRLRKNQVDAVIIDKHHEMSIYEPGHYSIQHCNHYRYVSFIPFSPIVKNLTLEGFYYPLQCTDIEWGSTRCISNSISRSKATFSFTDGIVLLIRSKDNE